jgi:Spy/CpxP family protein refolding chaperone
MNRSIFFAALLGACLAAGAGARAGARTTTGAVAHASQTISASKSPQSSTKKAPYNPEAVENDDTLNLTPEQKDKIKSIRDDAKKQIQEIAKDKTLTPDQQTQKTKQVTKETRAQVFAVLTPEQQKTWSAEQRERREEKKAGK